MPRQPVETVPGTAESRRIAHAQNSTNRGRRSKAELIAAARRVFEREGYFDASIEDIVAEAGMARGSFYTYFTSKSDVLEVIASETLDRLAAASVARPETLLADPLGVVEQFNLRYLAVYEENARMLEVLTQVAVVDPVHQRNRLESRRRMVDSIANAIRIWQHHGYADDDLDPSLTAAALASMMTNFAYWWMIGHDAHDRSEASRALITVWRKTLGLTGATTTGATSAVVASLGPVDTAEVTKKMSAARRGYWR